MRDIEQRLDKLERENRVYRTGLTVALVVIGVGVVAGFSGEGQDRVVFPRNIVADSIIVQQLTATQGQVNTLGTNRLNAGYVGATDGLIQRLESQSLRTNGLLAREAALTRATAQSVLVKDANGTTVVTLAARSGGAAVELSDANGQTLVALLSGTAGSIQVGGPGGKRAVEVTGDAKGGIVRTLHPAGRALTSLGVSDSGDGLVVAHTRNGNRGALLATDPTGTSGRVTVQREDGTRLVTAEAGAAGGQVLTFKGRDEETARLPAR